MGQRPMEILTVDTNVLRHQRIDEQIVRNKVCILSESAALGCLPQILLGLFWNTLSQMLLKISM